MNPPVDPKFQDNRLDTQHELPDPQTIEDEWVAVQGALRGLIGSKTPDLQAALYLLGLRIRGWGPGRYTKEQKQDLMNLACCQVLSLSGYFKASAYDADGWPIWEQRKGLPPYDLATQERLLKHHVYLYCDHEGLLV